MADTDKSCHAFPASIAGYRSSLHAMDCNDIVIGAARSVGGITGL